MPVLALALSAQWVTFLNETAGRLVAAPGLVLNDVQEKDYAWADLDQDGDIDLVIVRKEPVTTRGRFPNVLLMNEGGVLTDRTALLASASTVSGSNGFLDATNDRDVAIADVNGDGWLDVITATTLSGDQPKYISHPRIYINRGNDGQGNWLGLLFDDANRFPTMPDEPRFCSVSAGDIDNDGDIDLYMGDYQQGGARAIDLNDRLFINNGLGYFTDESSLRMSATMLESSFAMATAIVDVNGDGKADIFKDDALNAPQGISVSYNDGAQPGFFSTYQIVYAFAPYHITAGDLNNDGQPDFVATDDGQDRYVLHGGTSGGVANYSNSTPFSYSGGFGDDGFGGNSVIADLNNDGWNDVIITDVDVDIAGCNRRSHIYRNLGNAPNVTLDEQATNGAICGIPTSMLVGTHDVAVFDINGDGWLDMVLGRCTGTQIWINQPPVGFSFAYPQGLSTFLSPTQSSSLVVEPTGIGGISVVPSTVSLFTSVNGAPFQSVPMNSVGPNQFGASFPSGLNCADQVRYYVQLQGSNAQTYTDPPLGASAPYDATVAEGTIVIYDEGFEGAVTGWTIVNTAVTAGAWEVAIPNGTINAGVNAAPSEDAQAGASNVRCFVTQNGLPGGAAGTADLDGGPTDLISPPFNMAGNDGFITYSRWYYSSGLDPFTIAVSGDGVNWVTVETLTGVNTNVWTVNSFRVSDFITPTATVQVRFRATDNPNNSVTEAAIDAFRVSVLDCSVCQASLGFGGPGAATLSVCGGDLSTGTTADLAFSGGLPNSLIYLGVSMSLNPVAFAGGTILDPNPLAILPFFTDANGSFVLPLPGGGGPVSVYAQVLYQEASGPFGVGFTNIVRADWLP